MIYIKTYEDFTDPYQEEAKEPDWNPSKLIDAKSFVEEALNKDGLGYILKCLGYKMPKDLTGEELDEEIEKIRVQAIKYFMKNPNQIIKVPEFGFFPYKGGSVVPKTNNIGGIAREN